MTTTDRIERQVLLRAPQEKVWRAISDAKRFGSWFGMDLDGPFVAGKAMTGRIRPTTVDPETAKMQERYAGTPVAFEIDRIEPMTTFSFRWHPYSVDTTADYAAEPTTLVTFTLAPAEGGTLLTIVESGFDHIPIARRAQAYEANAGGWAKQAELIEKYLTQAPS